jgi:hypothetical protein
VEDQARFRRFKDGCPFYRENWVNSGEAHPDADIVLYEIYCLRDRPPVTQEEQDKCMRGRHGCWRLTPDLKPPRRPSRHPETAWPPQAVPAGR